MYISAPQHTGQDREAKRAIPTRVRALAAESILPMISRFLSWYALKLAAGYEQPPRCLSSWVAVVRNCI